MWEFLKDVIAYIDWDTGDPFEISLQGTQTYSASKGIGPEEQDSFRWISPRNLWQRTQGPNATYTQHFEINHVRRLKREVVVKNSEGEIDLVLCRKK